MVTLQTLVAMLQRKLLYHPHPTIKRRLQRIWSKAVADETPALAQEKLVSALMAKLRPNLSNIRQRAADDGYPSLLATAAVIDYAAILSTRLDFTHLVCTPAHDDAGWQECSGAVKRDRVLDYLAAQGWQAHRRIVFTDHADDLPLIRMAAIVLWFGSDEDLIDIRRLASDISIVPCRNASAEEIYRLFYEPGGIF
jgi:phosphoserine phosphatase